MKQKITEETKAMIIEARRSGKQYDEIADEFNISRSYATNLCIAAGLPKRTYKKKSISKEHLVKFLSSSYGEPVIDAIKLLVSEMVEAGDGNISYSDGNIGIDITDHAVEIVDIENGSLATLKFTIN